MEFSPGDSNNISDEIINSQIYLENLVEIIPYFIFWKNAQSVYLGCNQQFANLVGKKSPEEVIGKTDFDLGWGEGEAEIFREGDRAVMAGHPKVDMEELLVRSDGSLMVMLVNKVPLRSKHNDYIGVLGTSTDITARKKMEEDLRIATKNAEAANHGLTLMTGSVVHELRTPLTSVNLAITTIKQYLPELVSGYQLAWDSGLPVKEISPSELPILSRCAENIQAEIKASNMFIDMLLLNLTEPKISTEKMQDCSIRQCIEKALERYPLAEEEKDKIIFEPKDDFSFKGNQLLTIHIIFNLLKNALYYIKVAGKGEIYIWLEPGEEINKLHFKDTAKGISPGMLSRIFERFYSNTQGGSGIGLAFCKMTMELFGGKIHCESVEGDYTEFVLGFPSS